LQTVIAPCKDEPEDLIGLDSKGLVNKVTQLEGVLAGATHHGFKNGVDQVKVVNPRVDLSIDGIYDLKFVEGGMLVTPDDFQDDELMDDAHA
jgi:hypothetical protein